MSSSSTFFSTPHPLVPLATFNVEDAQAALEEGRIGAAGDELALRGNSQAEQLASYSLFAPSTPPGLAGPGNHLQEPGDAGAEQVAPDFLGRLHHLKTLFRMPASQDPVSVMIHRCGPLLILDDGPRGWSRGASDDPSRPLPPLPSGDGASGVGPPPGLEDESQLMLAALGPSMERMLMGYATAPAVVDPPPGMLPEPPSSELRSKMRMKNTFIDIVEDEVDDPLSRSQSAPGRVGPPPALGDHADRRLAWRTARRARR